MATDRAEAALGDGATDSDSTNAVNSKPIKAVDTTTLGPSPLDFALRRAAERLVVIPLKHGCARADRAPRIFLPARARSHVRSGPSEP
jgi:hypothetical protein